MIDERHLFGEVEPAPPIESSPPRAGEDTASAKSGSSRPESAAAVDAPSPAPAAAHPHSASAGDLPERAASNQAAPGRDVARPYTSAVEYHAIKALSAGMIWTMDSECALKAFLASPWNPDREPVNAVHFDIGTAAHLAVLEPHLIEERVVVHGHDEYRSKEAKAARVGAYEAGKTPLKPAEWAIVEGVRLAIHDSPASRWFKEGTAEASLTWEWEGMLCKCRPDYLADDNSYILDLKTSNTCNPRAVARKAFNDGWFVRAAWYMAGVKEVTGTLPDKYLFVVVEKDAPHIVEMFELDTRALMLGDQIIERAMNRAAACFSTNHWPGYGDGSITTLRLPSWQMAERAEEFNE